jgi:hypothetical protein
MSNIDNIKEFTLNHRKIILISFLGVMVVVGIFALVLNIKQIQEQSEIKQAITNSTESQFGLKGVAVRDADWYLAGITLIDGGVNGYSLLKKGSSYEVVLGPGTSFSPEMLFEVGAPDKIFEFFFGDQPVWVNAAEVYGSLSSSQIENTKSLIAQYTEQNGIDLKKVLVEKNSFSESTENLRQPDMTLYFDFDVRLNEPGNEKMRVKISNSKGVVIGKIIDSTGEVVAEKTFSIDYSWRG